MVDYKYILKYNAVKLLALLFILCFNKSWGQAILTFDFAGALGNEVSYGSSTNNANINTSTITRSGLTASANGDRFGSTNFATSGTIDLTKYIEFTVTPLAGYQVSITSVVFLYQRSATGPLTFALRSSLDAYGSNLGGALAGTDVTTTQTFNFSFSALTPSCGSPVTFRFYAYASEASTGTGGPEDGGNTTNKDIVVNGSVSSCGACTPPTTTITPTTQTVCANTTATVTVSSSATTPTYQWQMSAAGTSGTFSNVVNGTPTGVTYGGATSASLTIVGTSTAQYYYQCLVTENGTCTATSSTVQVVVKTSPSITTQPTGVSTSSTGTASYTVVASGSGLTYQWQENTGSGFSNISNGGSNPTYAGATSSVMTISNPPLSMSGYSYQCIVSNSCGTVTTNGTSTLTVTNAVLCPYLVSAVINSCDGCADEGNNEFLVLKTGSYSFPVTPTNVNITYSNGPTNLTSSFVAQPASLASLNTATINACGTTFVDVSGGTYTVPANSTLLIINKGACFTGDWSAYCGLGNVYVAFSAATAWSTTGFFGNNNTARTFVTDFSAVNSACGPTTYAYNQTGVAGTPNSFATDGAAVLFNGSSPPTYIAGNGNCAPPTTILPIELLDFYGTHDGPINKLVWKVASEKNVSQYIIEKSEDGFNFNELTRLKSNEREGAVSGYSCEDDSPFQGITYYRLGTLEYNNQITYYQIIDIDSGNKEWNPFVYGTNENLILEFKNSVPKNAQLQLLDLSGKLLIESVIRDNQTKISTSTFAEGIYFLKITTPYKTENFKIIIQK